MYIFAVSSHRRWERWTVQLEEYYSEHWIWPCIVRCHYNCVRFFANVHQGERNGETEKVSSLTNTEIQMTCWVSNQLIRNLIN